MIYFFSDSHIGARATGDVGARMAHQTKVVRMLQMMERDATAIYILGDLFDYWYEYLWADPDKREYEPILQELDKATRILGIEVHFYIGNHDIWTFGWLAKRTGMIIHYGNVEEATICGKRVRLGHGDGVVPEGYIHTLPRPIRQKIRRFQALRWFFHWPVAQWAFRLVPPRLGNALGYEWARRSRVKEMAHPCGYKGEQNEELVNWSKEQGARDKGQGASDKGQGAGSVDYFIFGHRHIELDLELRTGAHVIILGDTWRQWTYARMTEEGVVSLEVYEE